MNFDSRKMQGSLIVHVVSRLDGQIANRQSQIVIHNSLHPHLYLLLLLAPF